MTRIFPALAMLMMAAACQPAPADQAGDPTPANAATPAATINADTPGSSAGQPPAPPPPTAPLAASPADMPCGAQRVRRYIGEPSTVPIRQAVARESGAVADRWIYPDSAVTHDRNPGRLNVIMEHGSDRIIAMRCG